MDPADTVIPTDDRKPSGHQRFDQSLDQGGPVVVAGCSFLPSDVLWGLDPIAYREQLKEFRQENRTETLGRAREHFPHPIAYRIYYYLQVDAPTERFIRLRDVWESVISFLYSLVLSESRLGRTRHSSFDLNVSDLKSKNISDRLACIAEIARIDAGESCYIHSVASHVDALRTLNQVRNDWSHRTAPDEFEAEQIVDEVEPLFVDILEQLTLLLEETSLWRFRRTLDSAQHEVDMLMGDGNPKRAKRELTTEQLGIVRSSSPADRRLFAQRAGKIFPLWPFALWDKPTGENHPQVLMYKCNKSALEAHFSPAIGSEPVSVTARNVIAAIDETVAPFREK